MKNEKCKFTIQDIAELSRFHHFALCTCHFSFCTMENDSPIWKSNRLNNRIDEKPLLPRSLTSGLFNGKPKATVLFNGKPKATVFRKKVAFGLPLNNSAFGLPLNKSMGHLHLHNSSTFKHPYWLAQSRSAVLLRQSLVALSRQADRG